MSRTKTSWSATKERDADCAFCFVLARAPSLGYASRACAYVYADTSLNSPPCVTRRAFVVAICDCGGPRVSLRRGLLQFLECMGKVDGRRCTCPGTVGYNSETEGAW